MPTDELESFWNMLTRRYYGTYHKMRSKHLNGYVAEFTGRYNLGDLDTIG